LYNYLDEEFFDSKLIILTRFLWLHFVCTVNCFIYSLRLVYATDWSEINEEMIVASMLHNLCLIFIVLMKVKLVQIRCYSVINYHKRDKCMWTSLTLLLFNKITLKNKSSSIKTFSWFKIIFSNLRCFHLE